MYIAHNENSQNSDYCSVQVLIGNHRAVKQSGCIYTKRVDQQRFFVISFSAYVTSEAQVAVGKQRPRWWE